MKSKVLFVTEKWPDGNPKLGLTNSYHNLFNSLKNSRDCDINIIHFDEIFLTKNIHIDQILVNVCDSTKPNLIVFSFLGDSFMNPSNAILKKLSSNFKICITWPDTGYYFAQKRIKELGEFCSLQVAFDNSINFEEKNLINLFAPQDENLYYPDVKTIPYSFIGSLRGYTTRFPYLQKAKSVLGDLFVTGGQREIGLTSEQYAKYIRSSAIGLNFPESPSGKDQVKGRVMEILASNSMLLEKKSTATRKYLNPNEDYIDFETPDELIDKLKYYKINESERLKISQNGYSKYMKNFSSNIFWKIVFDHCEVS